MSLLVVGLTGNVASGKSSVRRILERLGARTLDADAVVHGLYEPGAAGTRAVAELFGESVLAADGSVDRARLAARTTADPAEIRRLEGAVHPLVARAIDDWLAPLRDDRSGEALVAVVEATLLYEAGLTERFDRCLVVDAPLDLRRRRAKARGLDPNEFDRREARLLPAEEKRRRADDVIENAGDEAALERSVAELSAKLRTLAQRG